MGIFVGTLVVADIFMESRMPAYVAEIIVGKAVNTCWAILSICLLTGFIYLVDLEELTACLPAGREERWQPKKQQQYYYYLWRRLWS